MAVGHRERAPPIGHVIDRPCDGCDHAEGNGSAGRELRTFGSGAERLDSADLRLDSGEHCRLRSVAADDRDVDSVEDPLRGLGAESRGADADGVEHDGHACSVRGLPR